MLKFLFSRSPSWSVLLVTSLVLTICRSALLFSSHCLHRPMPVFVSPLVHAATVRHVSRHATLLVRALLIEPLIFDELFAHPRADPRVLLVVRWLRHQPSRAARGPLAASPACTLSPTARCAWSRCCLRSCSFVTWPLKLCAAVLMALHESPSMALHGSSVQFCFVVVAFLVTVHVHVAILLWSALAQGLRVDASCNILSCL